MEGVEGGLGVKTRVVKQYCCEFCRKRGLSASHMAKHESSCTLNPNRVCRVCKMDWGGERTQKPITELMALLPDPKDYKHYGELIVFDKATGESFGKVVNSHLTELRQATGNCPACIMAALRQKGIPVPVATDFDFTTEMKAIWDDINDSNALADARACRYG